MNQMKIDTHTHCLEASRCAQVSPERLVQAFQVAGYGAVVLTNHCYPSHLQYFGTDPKDQVAGYLETYRRARDEGRRIGLRVLFGIEVKLIKVEHQPEFLLFGFSEKQFSDSFPLYTRRQEELFDYCHAEDLLMVQTHPFRREQGYQPADPTRMHGVEVWNGHPNFDPRLSACLEMARGHGLRMTAGSDFHILSQAGSCGMLVDPAIETAADLKEYLKACQPPLFDQRGRLSLAAETDTPATGATGREDR